MHSRHPKAISLFSGAGGMDVGFIKAGFEVVWANDLNVDACKSYAVNHGEHVHQGSIDDLLPALVEAVKDTPIDCVFGGPPCQGFSVAGKMDINDPRSALVWSFMNVVQSVKPAMFVMENVKALAVLEKFKPVREKLFSIAASLGYRVDLQVLNSKDYGVPQGRERMFLVGIKGRENTFATHILAQANPPPALKDLLLKLGRPGSKTNNRICKAKVTAAIKPVLRKSPYAGMLFNGQGRPINIKGQALTLPASMGGNRTPIVDDEELYEGKKPWIAEYHQHLMEGGTPTSEALPSRLRRLTVDEALAIQTFPTDYKFVGKQSSVFRQIGNAVPCQLAYAVASAAREMLEKIGDQPVKKRVGSLGLECTPIR